MQHHVVDRLPDRLPPDDDHPYRTGAWRPTFTEYDAPELDVVEGAVPAELAGIYLRNTENPVMPALGRYHPFDGDGMLHAIRFAGGRAAYRNRFVRTSGLAAELAAGAPQWAGIVEPPAKSLRDGHGARGRMKDASSTDVIVHAGRALTTFYQCGEAYQHDPETLAQLGPAPWVAPRGVSAHLKIDPFTRELIYFGYATTPPFLWFGVVDAEGRVRHETPVDIPGPRLPHDIAFTERFVILNDLPLFWDPALLARGLHVPRFHRELPSRFAVIERGGGTPRWFEAAPTYVLHWINAFEDGDTVVLDGYAQADPMPRVDRLRTPSGSAARPGEAGPCDPDGGPYAGIAKLLDAHALQTRPHRWRFDLRTGACREERLFDAVSEFPSIHYLRPGRRHRYAWSMTTKPGWFLFDGLVRLDLETGQEQRFAYPDGVYASEAPMAPRPGGTAEDDGWIVTFVSDTIRDRSECHVFDAAHLADGPIARVALPERICVGTHACWHPLTAS